MSTLTEEQKKRIDENRRKALERRALRSGTNQITNNQISARTIINLPNSAGPSNSAVITSTSQVKCGSALPVTGSSKSKPVNSFRSNNTVQCQCILLSRKRFYIHMSYHKQVIEIFKTLPSRMYDAQTRNWNFSIDDHDQLVSLLKPLYPDVLIKPLPQHLLKVFKQAEERKQIKECDLSHMDKVLVNALLPFQKIGLYFGIQHGGKILLADDMGLGKTIQAIAIVNYFMDWPLLVVTPSSVKYSWLDSFNKWSPSVGAHEISVINSGKDHISNDKVVIMSYDLLSKMETDIINRKFKSAIFDESHFIKNPKAARTKTAQSIMKKMNRIILLSGTPALSRPLELFTQVSALCPKYFNSITQYGIRYCNGKKGPYGWEFNGSSNMGELQLVLEELLMLRRLKSEVIQQLPAKRRQMIVLDPTRVTSKSKVMKACYEKLRRVEIQGMERRGALLDYFHETGKVKIQAICDYIKDLLESNKKFLCFAHHQSVMDGICACIQEKKVDYIRIDGSVLSENRKKLCEDFQLKDSCKVAVLSITAANCGITLTASSLVIFAELFWNPGILTQAEDRAHRIGQEDSVLVQYLIAKGTADDEIWPLVQLKLDILNKAGLSKDNFKTADTIVMDDSSQPTLNDFWGDFQDVNVSEKVFDIIDGNKDVDDNIRIKRLKT